MKRICVAVGFLCLGACTSLPPLDFTIAEIAPAPQQIDAKLSAVSVDRAPGAGKKEIQADDLAFPLWKEALSGAVAKAKVFNDASAKGVKINVRVQKIDAPEFGIEMVTKTTATYDVVDAESGATLFSKVVEARGAVGGDYAFAGMVRAQESINRAVRNNISEFIKALESSDLTSSRVASAAN